MQLGSWGGLAMRGNVWKRIRSYWEFGVCYAKCLGFCEGLLMFRDLNFGVRASNSNIFIRAPIISTSSFTPHTLPLPSLKQSCHCHR